MKNKKTPILSKFLCSYYTRSYFSDIFQMGTCQSDRINKQISSLSDILIKLKPEINAILESQNSDDYTSAGGRLVKNLLKG
jgi:hypothetical protein